MSKQFLAEYFPTDLAILDTQEILGKVTTNQWKLVDFPRRHPDLHDTDKILSPWVLFATHALRGLANVELVKEAPKKVVSADKLWPAIMDSVGNRSYVLWAKALENRSGDKESILSVQSAFAMLLSVQAQAKLPKEVKRKIQVDENLHKTVDKLVENMYGLAMDHRASENRRWNETYGEE